MGRTEADRRALVRYREDPSGEGRRTNVANSKGGRTPRRLPPTEARLMRPTCAAGFTGGITGQVSLPQKVRAARQDGEPRHNQDKSTSVISSRRRGPAWYATPGVYPGQSLQLEDANNLILSGSGHRGPAKSRRAPTLLHTGLTVCLPLASALWPGEIRLRAPRQRV